MVNAPRSLNAFYTNMINLACLTHRLHRFTEKKRKHFPKVNNLISNRKKFFLEASTHVLVFKTELPNIPLPSKLVIIKYLVREAAFCYFNDF